MREYIDAAAFKEMMLCADAALSDNIQIINDLNVFPVPDGDTGTNMSLTMNSAAAELRKKSFDAIIKSVLYGNCFRLASGRIICRNGMNKNAEICMRVQVFAFFLHLRNSQSIFL